jgi:hypothetical protein
MACMCGDTACPSCGPAQGYNPAEGVKRMRHEQYEPELHTHECVNCGKSYECGGDYVRVESHGSRGVCMGVVDDGQQCEACSEPDPSNDDDVYEPTDDEGIES